MYGLLFKVLWKLTPALLVIVLGLGAYQAYSDEPIDFENLLGQAFTQTVPEPAQNGNDAAQVTPEGAPEKEEAVKAGEVKAVSVTTPPAAVPVTWGDWFRAKLDAVFGFLGTSFEITVMLAGVALGFFVYSKLAAQTRFSLVTTLSRAFSENGFKLAFWATMAAVALSISSFFTTFFGMSSFHLHFILAFIAAAGIQFLLFVSSWLFAEAMGNHRHLKQMRKREDVDGGDDPDDPQFEVAKYRANPSLWVLSAVMVVLSMGTSVFFSLDSLFGAVYKPEYQLLNNLKVARSDIGGIFDKLRDKVDNAVVEELEVLIARPDMRTWENNINAIMVATGNSKSVLVDAAAERRFKAQSDLASANREAKDANAEFARLSASSASLGGSAAASGIQANVEQLRQAQIQADAERIRVQAKVRNLEQKIAEEIKAGGLNPETGERRKTGCGPVCGSQRLDLAAAQTQLAAATKAEAAAERELVENNAIATANQQRRLAIGGELAVAQDRKEIADANLAKAQTAMSKIITEGDTSDPTVAGGVISNVQLALTNFKNTGKISYMDEVTESCNTIYSALSATETTRPLVSGQSCDSSAVAAQLDKLRRLGEGKTAMAGKCSSGEAFNAFEAVKPMIDMGRNCISLSGLGFEAVKPERDLVDQVETENSPNTSNFQKTLATLKRGDDLALLTLGIAVSIDFFVFASALFAAGGLTGPGASRIGTAENKRELDMANHCTPIPNDDDPGNIRNLKLIVRTAQPMVNDPLYDEVKPDCQIRQLGPEVKSLSAEEQMLLKTHLTKFVSLGHAKFMGEDDPVFILSGVFYTQMTTDIGTYEFERTEKQREAKERERIEKEEVARDPGKAKAQKTAPSEPEQATDAYNGKGAQQNSSDGKIVSLKRLRDNFLSGSS